MKLLLINDQVITDKWSGYYWWMVILPVNHHVITSKLTSNLQFFTVSYIVHKTSVKVFLGVVYDGTLGMF